MVFLLTLNFRYKDSPGNALKCSFEGTLKDLLVYTKPKGVKKIYYQQLSIPVFEFENKRAFKVRLKQLMIQLGLFRSLISDTSVFEHCS